MKNMKEIVLPQAIAEEIALLYAHMEERYDSVARQIGFSCRGCPDNCCDSYFLHYTYCEWAYLWAGLRALEPERLAQIIGRAKKYRDESEAALAGGNRPQLMCPLNEEGLCALYAHRLMICRLHGIPAVMNRPDGKTFEFPGCFRCQETVREAFPDHKDIPTMNRTELLGKFAALESQLLMGRRHLFPRVRRTIADMIADGPPRVDKPYCER